MKKKKGERYYGEDKYVGEEKGGGYRMWKRKLEKNYCGEMEG